MPMEAVAALGLLEAGSPLTKLTISRRDVGSMDVLIRIAYCGICHTDLSAVRDEWSSTRYPLVPGHEIVGVVEKAGEGVRGLSVGDHVGVGTIVASCHECENCLDGLEQYCLRKRVSTYNSADADGSWTYGGFASHIVVDSRFVAPVPPGLPLESAAPLMCAGITVYSPMKHWGIGPGSRLGVVGLGGLGHLAVKIAKAFGAHVTVFSRTADKANDAFALGADAYCVSSDKDAMKRTRNSLDMIISTASAPGRLDRYVVLLRRDGTFVSVGLSNEDLRVHPMSLLANRRSITSSNIGSPKETAEMLEFCARHSITAEVEVVSAAEVNSAIERLEAGEVRYRFALDLGTL
jgi:uncharacterized zinc-type alcohol dehydrogenase-like protein